MNTDEGQPTEAYGRIRIDHSQISILNGEYVDWPELDDGLVAATENYVAIGAVSNGTMAAVRLVIHDREPAADQIDDDTAWESDGTVTVTFTAPPFFMVGDSLVRGGADIDWALQHGLDLEEGTYTFHVRAKGLLDSQEKFIYDNTSMESENEKPAGDLIQQFRIDIWPAEDSVTNSAIQEPDSRTARDVSDGQDVCVSHD
jgi:hypothetical protein